MNLNEFAKEITLQEGKKRQVSIGQVKEIMRLVFMKLAREPDMEVIRLVKRYK